MTKVLHLETFLVYHYIVITHYNTLINASELNIDTWHVLTCENFKQEQLQIYPYSIIMSNIIKHKN